ncbi:PIN domain-containing protein [Corynebacterium mastitidis]|uniref:PIN domain-containing protein n=1 Tax=Corynebacterium mastitidis TaxID=161890 RepID=A0ABU8NVJ4_9CORY
MSRFTALLDANVLYPSVLRDVLIRLAGAGVFRARWTDRILDEVFTNLVSNRPDLDPARLQRTRELMRKAVDDCLVTGYEGLIEGLSLPDPDDRHVLAAAIKSGVHVIVTDNRRDFPQKILSVYGIKAQGADEFLCHQIDLHGMRVHQAVACAAAACTRPPRTIDDVLDGLSKAGAPVAAGLLRR